MKLGSHLLLLDERRNFNKHLCDWKFCVRKTVPLSEFAQVVMHFLKRSCNLIFKDTNNSFWMFKICLNWVTVICLASYIRLLWMIAFILNLSDDVWCECLLSVQLQLPPLLLESSEITWNNKRGWSVPRRIYDQAPMFFGFFCSTSVHNTEHKSAVYFVHPTGETCSIFIWTAAIWS